MMRGSLVFLTCGAMLACGTAPAIGAPPTQAEWASLFPSPPANYAITFEAPVVAKGDNPVVYRLTARYDWLGNDFRAATATMARDPDFKTRYAAETMKKAGAEEIKVGKKTAWLRSLDGAGFNAKRELVLPLADDKALILTAQGNFGEAGLKALAEQFDPVAVEAALSKPPPEKKDK